MKKTLMLVVTLLVFFLLVKLGFWQLERGEQKREIEQQWQARASHTLAWPLFAHKDLAGYRLVLEGKLLGDHSLLLDNKVFDGQVGYQWLVPLEVETGEPWLLLDLGFIPASKNRQKRPILPVLPEHLAVSGVLYSISQNRFNYQLLPESGTTTRIQALNWPELENYWQHDLVPQVLLLDPAIEVGYVREYQVINMSPHKHNAYAVQWFGLALAWLVIVGVILFRSGLQPEPIKDNLIQNNNIP